MELSNTLTSVVLVDHRFKALTDRFLVETTSDDIILDLKEKVKETFHGGDHIPHLNSTDVAMLAVWKTMGALVINTSSHERMAEILRAIDVDDKNTIRSLPEELKLADLGLSNFQTLLIQIPGAAAVTDDNPVGDVITTDVAPEYKHCFLKANSKRGFTNEDIESNGIRDSDNTPEFVADHERILNQKRKLAPKMRVLAEGMIDEGLVAEYFCSTEESSESSPIVSLPEVNLCELQHLVHLSFVNAGAWRTLDPIKARFKESDAYWLFFSAFTYYYQSYYKSPAARSTIDIKQRFESWPFSLLIEVDKDLRTYRPKNDFLLLKHDLPRLAVEVNSDLVHLMLQGASIVRFANTKLDTYKEKDFVFVAIYIHSNGKVDRYLLYQDEKIDPLNPHNVYRKLRTFQLAEASERMSFALELYNLSSTWHDGYTEDHWQVRKLKCAVNEASMELSAYTGGGSKHLADTGGDDADTGGDDTDTGEDQCQPKKKSRTDTSGPARQLQDSGYEVVPDVFERDGETWGLIDKPPPHVRIVYRRSDPDETEYIAKHLREGSNELAIHEYLQSRPSQSPYINLFIEAVPSTTREWLILPKLYSIARQWFLDENGDAGRVRLGWGLIKGLAYLHEYKIAHRDIKPDNLVRDKDFNLKIIDFDIAIKVEDENTEIKGYRGTEGWTAPEIGKEGGPRPTYSPIKADRWSCGRVILRHIMVGDTVMNADRRLLNFANRLIAKDPQQRPSLLESHVASILHHGVSRPRQDSVDVDGESMELPDAKRPRLE